MTKLWSVMYNSWCVMNKREMVNEQSSALREAIGASFQWSWDDRFDAILSEYSIEEHELVKGILDSHFSDCWDQITIDSAPEKTKSDAGVWKQIREGQLLYASLFETDQPLMAAIWPWGDGKTVSLRIKARE